MIRLDSVTKQHGKQILFLDASCALNRGEKVGLVGPNGAGKSTIFRMIMKEEAPDGGSVAIDRGTTIGYFSQDVGEMHGKSVVAATLDGAGAVSDAGQQLHELEHALADPANADKMEELVERFGEAQARFEELGGYALEARAREILAGLGFSQEVMDGDVGALSGGWKMRVALARILLMKPDAMLLDEPTNHLDIESILWLENFLKQYDGALMMTSHDRELMNRIVGKIVEIDGGELTVFSGNYEFYVKQRAMLDAQQESAAARQAAMLAKEEAFIARFKARASPRGAGAVAREEAREDRARRAAATAAQAPIRFPRRAALGRGRRQVRRREQAVRLARRAPRARFSRPPRRALVRDGRERRRKVHAAQADRRRGRARLRPRRDRREREDGLLRAARDGAPRRRRRRSGRSSSCDFPHASIGSLRTLAGVFGFSGDDVEKKCRILSGGEKARLVLAQMLYDPPNFLVLDEPTNHLDIDTKQMLIEALAGYEGTMLFVSHDRHFLQGALEPRPRARAQRRPQIRRRLRRVRERDGGRGARRSVT